MNRPTKIMVLGRPIGVMWDTQELIDSCAGHDIPPEQIHGLAFEDEELIVLREDMEPRLEMHVLFHEVLHFLNWYTLPAEHRLEEGAVDQLSRAISQVLYDNKGLQTYVGGVK